MRPAANLTFLFHDSPFRERFAAAASAGFRGVEILFPYEHPAEEVSEAARAAGVEVVLINTPPGNREAGGPGYAALPGQIEEFRDSFETALTYARAVNCARVHVLAGSADAADVRVRETYVANLQWAADLAAPWGVSILIEPLNRYDFPGYALATPEQAAEVIAAVGRDNLGLQFDMYHWQIMGGDLTRRLTALGHLVRHVQISSVPGRGEPDRGEVNLGFVLEKLEASGYAGWISGEYRPVAGTVDSLRWLAMLADVQRRQGTQQ